MSFSEVAVAISKVDYAKLQQGIEELKGEMQQCVGKLMDSAYMIESSTHRGYVILHWSFIKWNESYPEIQFLSNFLGEIKHYDYIRIGVEYDDVEYIFNSGDYVIDMERKIICS